MTRPRPAIIVATTAGISAVAAIISLLLLAPALLTVQSTGADEDNVVRDSATILLDTKVIPPKDFIHLYDSTPYQIVNGHIATKLPCDANKQTQLVMLVGQAPNLVPTDLELVPELSKPGNMCVYHVDLPQTAAGTNTDIALLNPTNKQIVLPATTTVVIGINEIARG